MKKIDVRQTVTILANLDVIAGIVFLAFELRQNNEFLAAQARFGRTEARTAGYELSLQNPDLRRAEIERGTYGDRTEEQVLLLLADAVYFINLEYLWQEYDAGLLTEEDLVIDPRRAGMGDGESRRLSWEFLKTRFNPNFIVWMEENIVSRASPQ